MTGGGGNAREKVSLLLYYLWLLQCELVLSYDLPLLNVDLGHCGIEATAAGGIGGQGEAESYDQYSYVDAEKTSNLDVPAAADRATAEFAYPQPSVQRRKFLEKMRETLGGHNYGQHVKIVGGHEVEKRIPW